MKKGILILFLVVSLLFNIILTTNYFLYNRGTATTLTNSPSQTNSDKKTELTVSDIKSFTECSLDQLYNNDGTSKFIDNNYDRGLYFQPTSDNLQKSVVNKFKFNNYLEVPSIVAIDGEAVGYGQINEMLLIWNQKCKYTLNGTIDLQADVFLDLPNKKIYMLSYSCLNPISNSDGDYAGCLAKRSNQLKEYDLVQREFTKVYEITAPLKLTNMYPQGISKGYITSDTLIDINNKKFYISYYYVTFSNITTDENIAESVMNEMYKEDNDEKLSGVYEFDMNNLSTRKIHDTKTYSSNGIITNINIDLASSGFLITDVRHSYSAIK